jgi:hypothetical protein
MGNRNWSDGKNGKNGKKRPCTDEGWATVVVKYYGAHGGKVTAQLKLVDVEASELVAALKTLRGNGSTQPIQRFPGHSFPATKIHSIELI